MNSQFAIGFRSPSRSHTTRSRCLDKHSPFHQLLTNPILHFNMLQSKWLIRQIFFNNLSLCDLLYHVVLLLKFGIVLKRESFCCCPWTWCKAVFTPSVSVDTLDRSRIHLTFLTLGMNETIEVSVFLSSVNPRVKKSTLTLGVNAH